MGGQPSGTGADGQTSDGDADDTTGLKQVKVGDMTLCEDATVESNLDDWNGYRENLAKTGVAVIGAVLAMLVFAAAGIAIIGMRRKTKE